MKSREELKFLLVQIREDPAVKREELASFARYGKVAIQQIHVLDVFKEPHFDISVTDGFDALFVGGASEASVSEPQKYPFVESIKKLMLHVVEQNIPTFASCFGFQAAILAFGGEIFKDAKDFEMGTYPMTLTSNASFDPLFKAIPNHFMAISVHQEKAIELPEGCELLAYTEACIHAFRYQKQDFWAFQFHPELDNPCLTERLGAYRDKYTEDAGHFDQVIASLVDTPYSNQLVGNFVDYILSQ